MTTRNQLHPHPIKVNDPAWPYIIKALIENRRPRSVTAIARASGRSPAATWRNLRLLQVHGLVAYRAIEGGRGFEWWLR